MGIIPRRGIDLYFFGDSGERKTGRRRKRDKYVFKTESKPLVGDTRTKIKRSLEHILSGFHGRDRKAPARQGGKQAPGRRGGGARSLACFCATSMGTSQICSGNLFAG